MIVFGLTKKQTKWYIKSWCKSNPKFDFKKAWSNTRHIFSSVAVQSESRTLRAAWSPELVSDLEVFHGIDAEAELISLLEQEIARAMINDITNGYLNGMNE